MLTVFQNAALRAIANVGGVHSVEDDGPHRAMLQRKGKGGYGNKWIDVSGARIVIAASDGTYGYIGNPTMTALLADKRVAYNADRHLYVATGKQE